MLHYNNNNNVTLTTPAGKCWIFILLGNIVREKIMLKLEKIHQNPLEVNKHTFHFKIQNCQFTNAYYNMKTCLYNWLHLSTNYEL